MKIVHNATTRLANGDWVGDEALIHDFTEETFDAHAPSSFTRGVL